MPGPLARRGAQVAEASKSKAEHDDGWVRGIWWRQEGEETRSLLKEILWEPAAYKCTPLGQNYSRLHAPTLGCIYGRDAPAL